MDADHPLTSASEDADLEQLHSLAEGDERALQSFYRRYAPYVYSLAMSILQSKADAEDVTQETFWRVWKHAGDYDPARSTLKGWLAMLTRRIAIDRTRSRSFKARAREVTDVDLAGVSVEGSPAADEQHLQSHRWRRVHQALADLDEPYRVLISLSYFEGMTHTSMAEHLRVPLGTVKTRLREAINQLRNKLEA